LWVYRIHGTIFRQLVVMIESGVLQQVPGTQGVEIFPFIRKIDLMSSNSYILSAEKQIAWIDPGALDEQIDSMARVVIGMLEDRPRPVVVYLTHAHMDHCQGIGRLRNNRDLWPVILAAQEAGALALEAADPDLTLCRLLGRKMDRISVDIRLLCSGDMCRDVRRDLSLGKFVYSCQYRSVKVPYGPTLDYQTIPLNGHDLLEIYSTPGHSPDSICLRAGRLLFTGDLFFAPNSGMAGAYGWSQSELLKTIHRVLWILERKNILLCCSGHGRTVNADTAWNTLRSMYQDVKSLQGLEEITLAWARSTSAYAQDMMVELERLLSIILGRLLYVSHVLEELEEGGEADRLRSIMDLEAIEELFIEFQRFALELKGGHRIDLDLVHKAGQIIAKLEQVLGSRELGSVLDSSLLMRAGRIFNDYSIVYRGFKPNYYATDVDINGVLAGVLEQIGFKPYEDGEIIQADSYEDFLYALRTRIAHIDVLDGADIELESGPELPFVRMDVERFSESLIDLLERFCVSGARKIMVVPSMVSGWVSIRIVALDIGCRAPLDPQAMRFLERAFSSCGGIIQEYASETGCGVQIDFLPCKSF